MMKKLKQKFLIAILGCTMMVAGLYALDSSKTNASNPANSRPAVTSHEKIDQLDSTEVVRWWQNKKNGNRGNGGKKFKAGRNWG